MNVTMFVSYSHLDSRWIGADKEFRFQLIPWLASGPRVIEVLGPTDNNGSGKELGQQAR
jgi:hypothetical protein